MLSTFKALKDQRDVEKLSSWEITAKFGIQDHYCTHKHTHYDKNCSSKI